MSRPIVLPLRIVQVLAGLADIGLSAYVDHHLAVANRESSPPEVSFLIFAPIFSILSIVYLELAPRCMPRAAPPRVALVVEAINAILYFAGFIAFAVYLGNLAFCKGLICSMARADAVMAAVQFCAWIASTFLLAKDIFKSGSRTQAKPSPKQDRPMGQV